MATRHPSVDALLEHFTYDHLPPDLAEVSRPFCIIANLIAAESENDVPELLEPSELSTTLGLAAGKCSGPELTVALRKLLEAKDCAVRAAR